MIAIEDTYFTMAAKSDQVIDKVLDYQYRRRKNYKIRENLGIHIYISAVCTSMKYNNSHNWPATSGFYGKSLNQKDLQYFAGFSLHTTRRVQILPMKQN